MKRGLWKDYFSFTKKERVAVFILLTIIVVFVILPFYYSPSFKEPVVDEELQAKFDALKNGGANNQNEQTDSLLSVPANTANNLQNSETHFFYFDPNTIDAAGWKRLGVRDKTIQTILNYRNKGGHFKSADDLRKIYGLRKEEADALAPFVRIETAKPVAENNVVQEKTEKEIEVKKIDINKATVDDWKSLPGIGDVLSNRIVKFRNAIHGFKSVDDISKTYGLPDSTFRLILPYLTMTDPSSEN
jgi:competence protein ComEA